MSATFIGDLKRSAGTSDRYARSCAMPDVGDDALLLELGLGQRAARVLDDLAARDLDLERALEPEHHVEEVDRFRVEVVDQRRVGLDLLDVAAERVGDRLRDRRIDRIDFLSRDC